MSTFEKCILFMTLVPAAFLYKLDIAGKGKEDIEKFEGKLLNGGNNDDETIELVTTAANDA